MSVPHSRKDPLEDCIMRQSQTSTVQFTDRQCFSLKLCQSGSMTKTPDHRSFAESRFLNWVAYYRNLAGPSQITDDERLRCPIMWCRLLCDDQNDLLEHVHRCAHYSNGRYWCFHCQMEESFASCQCKHCQVPAFGKERLSVKVKRLFQKLGTKSHQKDHETLDLLRSSKGAWGNVDNTCSEYLPQYGEVLPVAVEMDIDKECRELEADLIHGPAELSGFSNLPAELDSENAIASTFKQEISTSRSETLVYPVDTEATGFASLCGSMEAIQALRLPSNDIYEPPSQFRNGYTIKPAIPEDSQLQLQSPVSPQNATSWASTSFVDAISESPTDTDFSSHSLFTNSLESYISPPSTRNSTMQSFSHGSPTFDKPSEYQSSLLDMQDIMNEVPSDITTEEFSRQEQASIIQADTFHSTERRDSTLLGSRNLLTPSDLLIDLWKVLNLHVVESSERLKMLTDSPTINELLSMTAGKIAYSGFEAWQRMAKGYFPSTIAHLYSLVHIAYACAIVVYDGQVENQLASLFTQSLSIGIGALSEEDREIYTNIAWSIWSPPMEDIHLNSFASADSTTQLVQPPSEQSWVKGKTPLRQNRNSERGTQFLHGKEAYSTLESQSYKGNELLNVLNHCLDIFEGTTFCSEVPSGLGNLADGFRDENFIQTIIECVTNPLMEGYFQPGPSLEAFIKVVSRIEKLVSIGHINTIREVEVELKCAGKSIAQSMELYEIFSSRVKDRCIVASHRLQLDPAQQIESHIEGINAMWTNLARVISDADHLYSDGARWHQSEIGLGSYSLTSEQDNSQLRKLVENSAVDRLSQSNITQAGIYRRSAIKRKIPSTPSSSSTPDSGLSPSSSATSNTLSESSESENFCCSICGFRPRGERRWHKRTMERHVARHGPGHKKVHVCYYEGCESSFTRKDNLAQHVRGVHLRNERQF